MTGNNIYAYGVIEKEDVQFESDGVEGGTRIYTVDYRTLSAVVSDVDTVEPERTDENVEAHDAVLQRLLELDGGRTVIPMQYGMAFKDAATLKNVLRGSLPAFRRALRNVDGTVELGLKLLTEEGASVDEEVIREDVSNRLDDLSEAVVENDLFSDRLVLNRSYLVDRDQREAFDAAVTEIEDAYDELLVQYTGPWAPYNFVDIHVGANR